MVFTLDPAGGAEVLKSIIADEIAALAQQIAAAAGSDAVVELSTTDRAKAAVTVPAEAQAKDGVLSRAASTVGIEVRALKQQPPKLKQQKDPNARKRGRPRKQKGTA
jgi:hypothetical protein